MELPGVGMGSLAPASWLDTHGKGVKVVVIDTGFQQALAPLTYPVECRPFTRGPASTNEHGTRVCQVVASSDPCCLGVAPACELYVAAAITRHVLGAHAGMAHLLKVLKDDRLADPFQDTWLVAHLTPLPLHPLPRVPI